MLQKSEGLVIRTVRYAESAVITGIFTREYGLLSFHVPGVRSSRNKSKGNLFQPLQLLELDIYHHVGRNLMKIREYKPAYIYRQLSLDMVRQSVGLFMVEVLGKCLHAEEAHPEMYDDVRRMLLDLDTVEKMDVLLPSRFMQMLSKHLGFYPQGIDTDDPGYFHLSEGQFYPEPAHAEMTLELKASRVMNQFLLDEQSTFTPFDRQLLLDGWIRFFRVHVPGFSYPVSLEVIRQILK
jgi:DNA repair protein RecO (recombination protein O)